jgi:hypothetical protein
MKNESALTYLGYVKEYCKVRYTNKQLKTTGTKPRSLTTCNFRTATLKSVLRLERKGKIFILVQMQMQMQMQMQIQIQI